MPNKELSYVNYNGETYEINAVKVNNHTVQSDVPADYNWNKTRVELSNVNANGNDIATIALDGTETVLKAPAYTATSPISINSSTLAISHANSGVSANTYGTLSNSDIVQLLQFDKFYAITEEMIYTFRKYPILVEYLPHPFS